MSAGEEAALAGWWHDQAEIEIRKTVPKAIEYGSDDLVFIGRTLADLLDRKVTDEEATELGVFFYEIGKMARWRAAIKDGRRVSDDTLFDLGVYIKMAQRNRAVGGWPWAAAADGGWDESEGMGRE